MMDFVKNKTKYIYGCLFIFSILSSCNVITTIYGEDIIAEEYIFGNFDYSYMKLKLLKNNYYEKGYNYTYSVCVHNIM